MGGSDTLDVVNRVQPGWVSFLRRTLRSQGPKFFALGAVSLCALVPIALGLGKSLWRDEAWVANSVMSANLRQVFYYDDWLQTSPPLFLLAARWTVQALGTADWVFRVVPFAAYLASATLWWMLVRRLFTGWQAALAWTLLVLNTTAVLDAGQMKQYCSDLAASTGMLLAFVLYVECPSTPRFSMLAASVGAGLLLSYPLILLMPGIVAAMWITTGWRRAAAIALIAVTIFGAEYRLLIVPNTSGALKEFWTQGTRGQSFSGTLLTAAARLFHSVRLPIPLPLMLRPGLLMGMVGAWIVLGFWAFRRRFGRETHRWTPVLIACSISCVVVVAADVLAVYPISDRTSLFLLPALLLILAGVFEFLLPITAVAFGRLRMVPIWSAAMIGITCAIATVFIRAQWPSSAWQPEEDMLAAVSFLKPAVQRGDALWVHATASEAFKLYSRIEAWTPAGFIARGDTVWPCCRRPSAESTAGDPAKRVSADMETKLPSRLPARVWLLYSSSAIQLLGEQRELRYARAYLSLRGCTETPSVSFKGVDILSFECGTDGPAK